MSVRGEFRSRFRRKSARRWSARGFAYASRWTVTRLALRIIYSLLETCVVRAERLFRNDSPREDFFVRNVQTLYTYCTVGSWKDDSWIVGNVLFVREKDIECSQPLLWVTVYSSPHHHRGASSLLAEMRALVGVTLRSGAGIGTFVSLLLANRQ